MAEVPDADFASLNAHPTLAKALAARGYATATGVQVAVLEAEERDLLVSSQTGSGKTVAFGLLMGRVLLGDRETLAPAAKPRALVIAPTRELASQVQRELHWLFAGAGARVVGFTGGTDLRLDARALKRGVDVAVGTPGRLVDLTERGSLDLSGLEVVVLDEADEMLDLGFREPLELLLQKAPVERRTLLFSATLPTEIRALAKRYQRDALPVDPRQGKREPHEDIEHVAHLCANGERLRALVNVLRMADGERAIVFCRTREDVAELHRQLALRGFNATAISGDRAQAERTRALEALRQGRASVLVATNVAARGLDLPDVGLVIHADLAENADSLTHRSGRTGRAGKKGVNVFIVEQGQRRRAERLFSAAHLRLRWTAPPSAQAIAERDRERNHSELAAAAASPSSDESLALAQRLLDDHDALALVAALLDRARQNHPVGEPLTEVSLTPPTQHRERSSFNERATPRGARPPSGDMVQFQVNLGLKDRAAANWILPLICKRGSVTRREVGAIRVDRDRTTFEIAAAVADEFAANVAESDPRAPHVRIERAEGRVRTAAFRAPAHKPSHAAPAHKAAHAAPAHKPAHAVPAHKTAHAAPAHKPPHAATAHKPAHAAPAHKAYGDSAPSSRYGAAARRVGQGAGKSGGHKPAYQKGPAGSHKPPHRR